MVPRLEGCSYREQTVCEPVYVSNTQCASNDQSIINPQTAKCRPPNATQQNTAFLFYNKYLVIVGDSKDRTDEIKNGENELEDEAMGA